MKITHNQAPKRDIVGGGCAWTMGLVGMAFSLFLGCILPFCALGGVARSTVSGASAIPPEVEEAFQGALGPMVGVYLPGGLLCGLVMLLLHNGAVYGNLPGSIRGRWVVVTFAGGAAYWIVSWMTYYQLLRNSLFGLVPLLQQAGRGTQEETATLAAITLVGLAAGALGGTALGVPQWLVIRGHIAWAGRWLFYVLVGSTLLVGGSFFLYFWFSHGSSWN